MKRIATSCFLLLLVSLEVHGQSPQFRSSTRGFFLNGHLNGSAWTLDDLDVDTQRGGGLGFELGYGFNERISLYAQLDGASIDPEVGDNYGLAHVDIGVLFSFLSNTTPWRPYIDVALSGRAAQWENRSGDIEVTGGGISAGGGVRYFFSLPLALDLGLKWTVGELMDLKVGGRSADIEADATSARFSLGLSWYPGH